jgi:hypothetical protein
LNSLTGLQKREKATYGHDPGGKVSIPLPPHVQGSSVFGGLANEYRYRLTRTWGKGSRVMFVMMNPSTADLNLTTRPWQSAGASL